MGWGWADGVCGGDRLPLPDVLGVLRRQVTSRILIGYAAVIRVYRFGPLTPVKVAAHVDEA